MKSHDRGGVLAACISLILVNAAPHAAAAADEDGEQERLELEEVVVTGSNLKLTTAAEMERGAMPIEVVTREEIDRNPGESLARILKKQPVFAGSNRNPTNVRSGWGDVARSTANIRGLGENYTQVVVDGRRFSSETNAADLDSLPTEAIESTQILTGGSSAIYGPGAVAGVVDIKLRKDFEGVQFGTEIGESGRGDGMNQRYSLLFGTNTDRFRIVGSGQYLEGKGIRREDRALTRTNDFRSIGGNDWRSAWNVYAPMVTTESDPETLLVLDTDRVAVGETATSADDFREFDRDRDASSAQRGFVEEPMTRSSAHFVTEFDVLDERVRLYAQGFYDDIQYGDSPWYDLGFDHYDWNEPIVVPADNPYNPFGEEAYVWHYRFTDRETRVTTRTFRETVQAATGVRGQIGEFRYDVGFNYLKATGGMRGGEYRGLPMLESIEANDLTSVNFFGNQANSAAQMANLLRNGKTSEEDRLKQLDAKLSGPIVALPAGDLMFSVAAERRRGEGSWTNNGGDYEYFGDNSLNGSTVKRDVDAYAGELLLPVYRSSSADTVLSFVEVGAGVRYEEFSDTGTEFFLCEAQPCESQLIGAQPSFDTTISQFTVLVGLFDDSLRLRAAYGGGFVAPLPTMLMSPEELFDEEVVLDPITEESTTVQVTAGGNIDLKPEKASNITYGITYSPPGLDALNLNVDFWRVKIEDRIIEPDLFQLIVGTSTGGSIVFDPVSGYPVSADLRWANGGEQTASGVDAGVDFSFETAGGHEFGMHFAVTYTDSAKIDEQRLVGQYNWGDTLPRVAGSAGIEWARNGFSVAFDVQHREGVRVPTFNEEEGDYTTGMPTVKSDPYTVGNLHFGFKFGDHSGVSSSLLQKTSVWVGIDNVWDEEVPFIDLWGQGYDTNGSYIRGRYFYGGLRIGF